ncbi:MAG: alanine racemase C-terminal domain-containing protein [Owenweeksia sp.]|nr:alanine racemase C-terminal domain-containing protein [Owenweeksia sp.]
MGYGYGFSRSLSNTGRALIHGQRVSVVGTVNMNALMINISEIEGVQKGDEVILIGKQGISQYFRIFFWRIQRST